MTTYRIRADGDDTNATGTGTDAAHTWRTLRKACQVAGPGDTIEIMDAGGDFAYGSEHSFRPLGAPGAPLTITNFSGDTPVFKGDGGSYGSSSAILAVDSGSHHADIGGFTVKNNAQGTAKGRGIEISSNASSKANHLTFRDIVVDNVWERGFGGGGDYITLVNVEVKNFCMRNYAGAMCGSTCGGWASGIAPYSYSDGSLPSNWTLQSCYVHDGWGEGIICLRVNYITIEGCTVENSYSVSIYVDKAWHVILRNNTLLFNDSFYQRAHRNTDGIKIACEGTPLHSGYAVNDVLIYGNIVAGVRDGIDWFTDSNEVASTYSNIRAYFNSFYSLTGKGMRIERVGIGANAPFGCVAKNNIFDLSMDRLADPSAWTFDYNRWDSAPTVGTHTNTLTADPGYTSPSTAYGNDAGFMLDSGSAMIGAGVTVGEVPSDRDGNARAEPPSLGAFEFDGEGYVPPPTTSPRIAIRV